MRVQVEVYACFGVGFVPGRGDQTILLYQAGLLLLDGRSTSRCVSSFEVSTGSATHCRSQMSIPGVAVEAAGDGLSLNLNIRG